MSASDTASTSPPPTEENLDRISVCEFNLRLTLQFVRMADQKARFLLRIALALFAATFVGLPPSVNVLANYLNTGGTSLVAFIAVIALYGVCVMCLVVAMMKIISVIRPRIVDSSASGPPSMFFFQSVAQMSLEEFRGMVNGLSEEQATDELTTQIYYNALIARQKYSRLDDAINWMLGGGIFGVVFGLLVIVSVGLITP